jgi:type I restriction enzyme, S subunit
MGTTNWPQVRLADVAADVTVGHVGPMASEYVDEGIPFLRSQNVERLRINLADVKFITSEFHAKLRKSALSPGDVVIVRTGKPGACAVMPESLPVSNCSDLVIVRPGPNLDSRFLAYYINSRAAYEVSAYQVGAVQQHFNVESARNLRLNLPKLSEQQSIADILGTLDDKIELNRRMNETLEAMARAIFKSWFVDFDPVRAKAEGRQPFGMDAATAALFHSAKPNGHPIFKGTEAPFLCQRDGSASCLLPFRDGPGGGTEERSRTGRHDQVFQAGQFPFAKSPPILTGKRQERGVLRLYRYRKIPIERRWL